MNIETFREYCLSKKGVTEEFPFDEDTLVFKIGNKIFALTSLSKKFEINLKCDPELAIELREQYLCVKPGYHMNKKHWNTVVIDGSVPDKMVHQWIDHSFDIVFASLPKKIKDAILK